MGSVFFFFFKPMADFAASIQKAMQPHADQTGVALIAEEAEITIETHTGRLMM